ncbi:inner centromere protein A-like [Saccostrea echinata]|uniref:inner centromere protein A-like n=1 Tax=Saccostrea echinata TaxID=191078 RepID=UPI002A815887|nr:inner centromere protein A-like [Saccostrea echinata]
MDEFKEFLKICKSYIKNEPSLIKLIKKRHRECSEKYLRSSEFHNSLHITRAQIESNPKEIFLYLRDFLKELKSNKKDENEMKRKRENTPPAEDQHGIKRIKKDEERKEDSFSSTSATESGYVGEISGRCAKPGTSLANKCEDKLDKCEEDQDDIAERVEENCDSDPEIQIVSLESSSCEEDQSDPIKVTVSKEKKEHLGRKKVSNEKEDIEVEISNKETVSQEEDEDEDKSHNKNTVLLEKVEDFEVVLNEDYSNGSTGSSLVNYNISGTDKDSACDSTVLDEPDLMLDNGERLDVKNNEQSLANKKHFIFEKDSEKNSKAQLEKVSAKSNELSSIDGEKDDTFESAVDKYPDSTTTEPTEKSQGKVPMTPSKYKDVFQRLKTTVSKVKSLPVSPKHAVYSPDSSSKADSVPNNVDSHSVGAMDVVEEDQHPLQGEEIKKDEKDTDYIGSKIEDQAKSPTDLHKHVKSKSLSLKCKKKDQQEKDTLCKEDSCDSGETNQEKYIVISSSQDTDEDVGEKPHFARKLTDDFFQNAGESPIKIVQVTSGAALEAMDSVEEQQNEMEVDSVSREEVDSVSREEVDSVSREEEQKNVTQEESKNNPQKKLENSSLKEETKEEKTEVKSSDDEPSTSAKGATKKEKKGSKRQIERLEKLLKDIRDKIEELKETEVDLDDEDSAYIMEEKYQKKFVKVWNKLCEIKESSTDTGRPVERKFRYEGTRYPDINKKIERFVNKTKCFPDYHDVKEIIISVNKSKSLHIKTSAIDRLAREAFADVGDQLQKRREKDFKYTFLGHLPPEKTVVRNEDDPAYDDKALQLKLEENKKISKSRLNEVLEKYVQKQERRDEGEDDEDEEEEDTQGDEEEDNEEVDVPEMDQIINGESQDETHDSTIISKESRETGQPLPCPEIKKENTETGNQEQYSEVTMKEVWELAAVKEEKELVDTMKAVPVIIKPLDDDIVYIDDDDDDVMVAQEDLLDFSHKRTKQNTKYGTKPVEIKEKKPEVPNIIQELHQEIMNQFNSIKSSIDKGETLTASTIKPEVYTGKNFVKRKFPGYQVKNISKASSGISHTVSSKDSKFSSKTNQYKASLSVTNDSRVSCSVTSNRRKGSESNDLKIVDSKNSDSSLVRHTDKNQLKEFKDGQIQFIPLNKMGATLLEVNPEGGKQSLYTNESKTKSGLDEVVVYPKSGQNIVNLSGREPKFIEKVVYPKPGKKIVNPRPTQSKGAGWHHMMGTSPVLLDDSDNSSAEDLEPVIMSKHGPHTKPVQTSFSSAQGSSVSEGGLWHCMNSSEKGKSSGQSSRLSLLGEGERKYVSQKTAVKVPKNVEDDDIIILD